MKQGGRDDGEKGEKVHMCRLTVFRLQRRVTQIIFLAEFQKQIVFPDYLHLIYYTGYILNGANGAVS